MKKIGNFGESNLILQINEIVKKYGNSALVLDDAAFINNKKQYERIYLTTDPSPVPNLVHKIGMGDYYHSGWLCALKSISDIAAVGAVPAGLLLSLDVPDTCTFNEYKSFFQGFIQCAKEHGFRLLGGNIRESKQDFHAVSTGIGFGKKKYLKRRTAKEGDLIFIVDKKDFGGYWAGISSYLRSGELKWKKERINEIREMSLKPRAKCREARILLNNTEINFTIDNSDGLISSLKEITRNRNINTVIDLQDYNIDGSLTELAGKLNCDPKLWCLGWGGVQLTCVASKKNTEVAIRALKKIKKEIVIIGEITKGDGKVILKNYNTTMQRKLLRDLDGEQFKRNSFWKSGINKYIKIMVQQNVF